MNQEKRLCSSFLEFLADPDPMPFPGSSDESEVWIALWTENQANNMFL